MDSTTGDDPPAEGIYKLSPEILLQICSDIQGPLDDRDNYPENCSLAQLARTCKFLAAIVRPVLYRHLSNRPSWIPDGQVPSLTLLRSLAKQAIGDLVISANIESLVSDLFLAPLYGAPKSAPWIPDVYGGRAENSEDREWLEENGSLEWNDELFDLLRRKLRSGVLDGVLQPPRDEQPHEEILTRDLIVPLFLAALPNLVKCRLPLFEINCADIENGPPRYRWPFPAQTTLNRHDTSPAFSRLKELEIKIHQHIEQLFQPDAISYLLDNSPNLSTLWLEGIMSFPETTDFSRLRLKSLSFIDGVYGFPGVTRLVSSCRWLQELQILYDVDDWGTVRVRESWPFILRELGKTPSARTLRTLKIGDCLASRSHAEIVSDISESPPSTPSFTRFPSLKSFSITETTLFHPGQRKHFRSNMGPEEHSNSTLLDILRELTAVETLTIFHIQSEHMASLDGPLRYLVENLWSVPSTQLKRVRLIHYMSNKPPARESMVKLLAAYNIELLVSGGCFNGSSHYIWERMPFTPNNAF